MTVPYVQGSYSVFPYKANHAEGHRVNAGMDLVAHPDLIATIHEVKDFPELQQMLRDLNQPQGLYRTLGVDVGQDDDGIWYGYLEVCGRTPTSVPHQVWENLDTTFANFLSTQEGLHPQNREAILQSLKMEWRWVEIYGQSKQAVLSVFPCAVSSDYWIQLLEFWVRFLLSLATLERVPNHS
nr:MAG TPA: hypothetical protein [Caudoviricetes sp.]